MSDDAIVTDPLFVVTHAITIEQPPERVWLWLAQLGSTAAAAGTATTPSTMAAGGAAST